MADTNTSTEAAVSTLNSDWDPEDDDFVSSVVVSGVVLFTIGVAVLAAFFIYYMVRCVCWTCLGDECCDKRNKVRASQGMVFWNNILITALLVACIAGGAWLLYASSPIVDSLESLTQKLVDETESFKNSANTTIIVVEEAVGDDSTVDLSELKNAQELLGDAQEDFQSAADSTRDATDAFSGVIIFIGVCAVICAILGILCVFVRSIIFLYLYFILATFTVFALWSLAGFAFVGNKAFEETCTMMDLHASGQKNEFVVDNLPCDELAQAGDAVAEAQTGANAAIEEGNVSIRQLNTELVPVAQGLEPVSELCVPYVEEGGELVPNTNTDGCVEMTTAAIESEYSQLVCQNPEVTEVSTDDSAWIQCAVLNDPSTPMPNTTYNELLDSAETLALINQQLPTIRKISTCGFVDDAFRNIYDDECPGLEEDSYRLGAAALISAITLTITSFYFCICIQNIRKQDAPQPAAGESPQFMKQG